MSSPRRIAFVALLLVVALAGYGVNAATLPASKPPAPQAAVLPAGPVYDTPILQHLPPMPTPLPVAPPVRLQIPSLGIDAKVEALGVDSAGAMDVPHNIWNVGWFKPGPSPGAPGDAVIDGHVGLPGSPLVFAKLRTLAVGADVITVLADGTRNRFTVKSLQNWRADSRPDGLFSADGDPRLSLITCTGAYYRSTQSYADRLIVEADYVGNA